MPNNFIALPRLKELLRYTPDSGVFTWKVSHPRAKKGAEAGAVDHYGYIVIRLDGVLYKAHRLAWLYVHGEWPCKNLDHINRNKSDNRIANLRIASQSVNMHNVGARVNSKSGVSGVVWRADRQYWTARIKIGYKNFYLGSYARKSDAIGARKEAEQALLACAQTF